MDPRKVLTRERLDEILRDLGRAGLDLDRMVEVLADELDAAIDWREVLGPVTGGLLERVDRPILVAVARAVLERARTGAP